MFVGFLCLQSGAKPIALKVQILLVQQYLLGRFYLGSKYYFASQGDASGD
jgi:hypothetical protein